MHPVSDKGWQGSAKRGKRRLFYDLCAAWQAACSQPNGITQGRLGPQDQVRVAPRWPLRGEKGGWVHLMPGVLNDASLLGQDLNEPLGLPLVEHHASNRGDQRLVGEVERAVGVRGPCDVRERRTRDLPSDPSNQVGYASKLRGPGRAEDCRAAWAVQAEGRACLGIPSSFGVLRNGPDYESLHHPPNCPKRTEGERSPRKERLFSWIGGGPPPFYHQNEKVYFPQRCFFPFLLFPANCLVQFSPYMAQQGLAPCHDQVRRSHGPLHRPQSHNPVVMREGRKAKTHVS